MANNYSETCPRIGIDFHLVDKIFQGAQTHVLELFSEVIRISPDFRFYLFLDSTHTLLRYADVFSRPNVELIRMPLSNPFLRLGWQLPRLTHKYQLDLFHAQYIFPLCFKGRGAATIHDILFEKYPQYFQSFFRFRSHFLMRRAAEKAAHVFTVSQFSKNEIMSRYQTCSEKISVIENGVDAERFFPGIAGAHFLEKRSLKTQEYILSVGRIEPRKNHLGLIRAYAQLSKSAAPLVIVGQRDFGFEQVYQLICDLKLKERVMILEDVLMDELAALYRHARLFVYPSWAEGFGMPPLEAMASGVPVISSNTTSMPEVLGEAALLVDPGDEDALKRAMERLLSDPKECKSLVTRGFARVRNFSWVVSAKKVRAVYLQILQNKMSDNFKISGQEDGSPTC